MSVDEPIEIDADGARLRLHGRIDRLEWSDDRPGIRVIDYKTGRSDYGPPDDAVSGGRTLQLPLYLLAAARLLGREPQQGVAEYFYATRRGDFRRRLFHGAALDAGGANVVPLLRSLLDGIRGGDFHAEPVDCRYCAFDRLCDTSRKTIRERKATDPRAMAVADRLANHP
jgi:RecB family exonuclease